MILHSDSADAEDYDKLIQVKAVLEMHGKFKGINRKVQLKPTKSQLVKGVSIVQEAQLILKWGGVLTASGRQQAEEMGRSFRQRMYPGVDGLLRLHSTYRHDLKIYSSDEGRVQVTAAAFAKGLLDLDGHLTPILASLVRKDNSLLDDSSGAKEELEQNKKELHWNLSQNRVLSPELVEAINPSHSKSVDDALCSLPNQNPVEGMQQLHQHIKAFVIQLQILVKRHRSRLGISLHRIKEAVSEVDSIESSEGGSAAASLGVRVSSFDRERDRESDKEPLQQDHGDGAVTPTDMLQLGLARWRKLMRDFYHKKKKSFDLSKIPDIYDCAKYDVLHSPQLLELKDHNLEHIFVISKALADIIVPQEYGKDQRGMMSTLRFFCFNRLTSSCFHSDVDRVEVHFLLCLSSLVCWLAGFQGTSGFLYCFLQLINLLVSLRSMYSFVIEDVFVCCFFSLPVLALRCTSCFLACVRR